jgi:NAD(P)H-dependent FMN reductase
VALVLAISGSLRTDSTNTAALRTARAVATPDTEIVLYDGLAALPHFNPDDDTPDRLPTAAARLRSAVRAVDALLFSVPEYAGALPGSFKNLLDWLIGDDQPGSIYEKPVGWINTSARSAAGAYEELRTVLGYAHARIADAACVDAPVMAAEIGPEGVIIDAPLRAVIADAIGQLLLAVR